jgi:aminoglycoside 6-adenylyltransferase
VEALPNPGWHPTRLVYYVDGKIDFAIADLTNCARSRHDRSVRVLVDKDGLMTDPDLAPTGDAPPAVEEVEECVNWFYAAALMEAKLLARRERWQAKFREWDMMRELLRMVEWDHRARYGWGYDTWYNGKKISQWADPDVRGAAEACWAPYDGTAMAASLSHAVDLFARLAGRVSKRLAMPPFDHNRVIAEVRRLLAVAPTTT